METQGCTAVILDQGASLQVAREYAKGDPRFVITGDFTDSAEALAFLVENPADLLLADFDAPGGETLLRVILRDDIDVDVIALSAQQDGSALRRALYLGAQDYLLAPVSAERFKACVDGYLERLSIARGFRTADQETVDKLLHSVKTDGAAESRNERADRVMECFFEQARHDFTVKEIAEKLGYSTVTVRRYLKQLADAGRIVSDVDYNTGGHPRVVYRLP